jgi:hypothetical protein
MCFEAEDRHFTTMIHSILLRVAKSVENGGGFVKK